jgi:glycine hydroxymethyltransferase
MAVYASVMAPGDTLMALALNQGGHLTHGHKVNFSGRLYNVAHYEVSRETMTVDYDDVLAKAKEARPEGDRLRRLRLPAHGRDRPLPGDRDEVGRSSSATWRTSPGSSPPVSSRTPVEHCDFVPRRRTRRSPARAPASSSAARSTRRRSTRP